MPADATDLTCGYFFNNNNNNNLNNHKHNHIKAGLSSNSNGDQATSNENQLACVTNSSAHETGNTTSNNSKTSNNTNNKNQKVRISMELYKAKPQYLNTYKTAGHTHTAPSGSASSSASSSGSACSSSGSSQSARWQPATVLAGELYQWCKIKKMGAGLYNLGNNCYLNATLQCMAYTPSLSQWLVGRPHSPVCKVRPTKGFCTLCEVEKIIYDMFNSGGSEYAKPNSLCFNIKKVSNVFGVGTQEDASEFFTTLLESMTKAIKFPPNAPANPGPTQSQGSNILDQIFSFQFRSRITCGTCGRLSDTFETTNSWPVDVKYITDIRKGMMHFLREEVLDGENSYRCDACQRKVRATKKYSMQTAPNVLVVNLKRFDFTYAGKLSHFVTYPETLSLKTFVQDSETGSDCPLRNVSYKLYGVLVHLGYTSHSGHYYSYVRGPNDVWYKADDTQVSTVRVQDALDQNAYILFYNRVGSSDTHPLPTSAFLPPPMPVAVDYTPTPIPTPLQPSCAALAPTGSTADSSTLNNNKHIPQGAKPLENKFKATFVPAITTTTATTASKHQINESTAGLSSSSNSKTLNYDQVLKIKKMNKRKLKLLTCKQKLKDLKRQKKSLNSSDKDEARKKLKKRIKRAKKAVKRQKAKIKKLRKYDSCSESDSEAATDDDNLSSAESDWVEAAKVDKRKLHQEDFDQVQSDSKRPKMSAKSTTTNATTNKNSLSLLQQYSSASSAASSSDESESLSSSRSSRSTSRSSSTASNTDSKQTDAKQLATSQNDLQQLPVSSKAPATHSLYSSQNSSEKMSEKCPLESSSSKAAEAEAEGSSSLRENDPQTTSKMESETKWEEASVRYNRCSEDPYNKSSSYKTNSTSDFNTNNTNANRNYHYNKYPNNRSKHQYSHNWKSYGHNNGSSGYSSGYKQHNYNKGFNYNYNRYRLNNNNYSRAKSGSNYSRY